MDQTNQYFPREIEIQTFPSSNHQFTRSHFPRKAIPILISLSLFALLFSFSSYFRFSSYIPFLLSTFSMEVLLSYSTDRKYIFLLCNGILAFLITKSGLIAKTPLVIVLIENRIGEFRRKELELSLRKEPSTEGSIEVEEKKEEEKEEENREEKEEIKDNGIFFIANEEHEDEELENKFHDTVEEEEDEEEDEEEENKFDDTVEEEEEEENKFDDTVEEEENKFDDTVEGEEEEEVVGEEEEEKEEEGIGFLSLEELNKKCDAFIKLMREGIKI